MFHIDAKLFSFSFDGGSLIRMLYTRHVEMLRALFGLDVGAWSGYFLVSKIYEIGCLAMFYFVRDLEKMGSC